MTEQRFTEDVTAFQVALFKNYAELKEQGMSLEEIANKTKTPLSMVTRWEMFTVNNPCPTNKKPGPKLGQKSCKIWEKEEVQTQLITLYNQGLSDVRIAQLSDLSLSTVVRWRKEQDLPPTGKKNPNRPKHYNYGDRDKKMMGLYNRGLNDSEIGEQVGMSGSGVWHWRKRLGLPSMKNKQPVIETAVSDLRVDILPAPGVPVLPMPNKAPNSMQDFKAEMLGIMHNFTEVFENTVTTFIATQEAKESNKEKLLSEFQELMQKFK